MIRLAFYLVLPFIFSTVVAQLSNESIHHQFDSLFNLHYDKGFNGNVLYSKGEKVIYTGNFGMTKYEGGAPLNDSTLFELGSNTKQFTALAIMQLVEKDSFSLNSDIRTILPDFPYPDITVEQLLRHQSGLPDFMKIFKNKKIWNRKNIADNADVYCVLKERKPELLFKPGTRYTYSNTGYLILCMIIEKVSTLTFDEYLHKHIFEPAGMVHSAVIRRRYQPIEIPNNTEGYIKISGKYQIKNTNPKFSCTYLDGVQGDGSISSTLLDMKCWIDALRMNVLISEKSKNQMFSPNSVAPGYGFGFFIGIDEKWKDIIYHGGSWAGYFSWMYYQRDTDEFVVLLCNNSYSKSVEMFIAMKDILSKLQNRIH